MLDQAKTYEELILWQIAQSFVLTFIIFTQVFQKSKVYGLTTPFSCSSTSIVTNIKLDIKKQINLLLYVF